MSFCDCDRKLLNVFEQLVRILIYYLKEMKHARLTSDFKFIGWCCWCCCCSKDDIEDEEEDEDDEQDDKLDAHFIWDAVAVPNDIGEVAVVVAAFKLAAIAVTLAAIDVEDDEDDDIIQSISFLIIP